MARHLTKKEFEDTYEAKGRARTWGENEWARRLNDDCYVKGVDPECRLMTMVATAPTMTTLDDGDACDDDDDGADDSDDCDGDEDDDVEDEEDDDRYRGDDGADELVKWQGETTTISL